MKTFIISGLITAFFSLFLVTTDCQAAKIKVKGTGGALLHPNGDVQLCPEEAENKVCAKIPVPSASSSLDIAEIYDVEILNDEEEVMSIETYELTEIIGLPDIEGSYNGNQLNWQVPQ